MLTRFFVATATAIASIAIAKAMTDGPPPSSSSATHSNDDNERLQQKQEAEIQRQRENQNTRLRSLAKERREQLKVYLCGAASTLADSQGKHEIKTLTLEDVTESQLERHLNNTAFSKSSYSKTVKSILQASATLEDWQINHFIQGVNLLEAVTAPNKASTSDLAALAQIQAAQARIERLQQLKRQPLLQV